MQFIDCTQEQFGEWLEKNSVRLSKMPHDVGHSDMVIAFFGS